MENTVENIKKQIESLIPNKHIEDVASLGTHLANVHSHFESIKIKVTEIKSLIDELKKKELKELLELNSEKENLQKEVTSVLNSRHARLQEIDTQIEKSTTILTQIDGSIKEHSFKLGNLDRDIGIANTERKTLLQELTDIRVAISSSRREYTETKDEVKKIQDDKVKALEEFNNVKLAMSKLKQ